NLHFFLPKTYIFKLPLTLSLRVVFRLSLFYQIGFNQLGYIQKSDSTHGSTSASKLRLESD
ncbi:MAG: hypothetical protein ABF773_15360, partial [Lentilactobacillus hilgardii]|uniref:hypothetical protein n=1 Tax=Lentilactobacillus hilgardii TaxID=1588 RepID=UPI0039EC2582